VYSTRRGRSDRLLHRGHDGERHERLAAAAIGPARVPLVVFKRAEFYTGERGGQTLSN
jgi:hypothetical protein